jgi:hypothetical protein
MWQFRKVVLFRTAVVTKTGTGGLVDKVKVFERLNIDQDPLYPDIVGLAFIQMMRKQSNAI